MTTGAGVRIDGKKLELSYRECTLVNRHMRAYKRILGPSRPNAIGGPVSDKLILVLIYLALFIGLALYTKKYGFIGSKRKPKK